MCSNPTYFYGGLSIKDISKRNLYEYFFPSQRIETQRKQFEKWGEYENQVLSNNKYINTQSNWVRNVISEKINESAVVYKTGIILRPEFTKSSIWADVHKDNENPTIFVLSAPRPYKGVQLAIDAFAIVKKDIPKAKLRIAGIGLPKRKWLKSSLISVITSKIKNYGLSDSVEFLGNIDAECIRREMYGADVNLNASFIETYCLSLAEALALGVPSVASYTSALPELIENGVDGFLYPLGDADICAMQIIALLKDKRKSIEFSRKASAKIREKSDADKIVQNQVEIYKDIIHRARSDDHKPPE